MNGSNIDQSSTEHAQREPQFEEFIADLRAKFKEDQVVESGSDYELRIKDPVPNAKKPLAVIYPESTGEVQCLLNLANRSNVKLWVYSTGKNWGYLNTCGEALSVLVLLNRMNKIVHIDDELAYAIIEPGVTYEQLSGHLADSGYALWTDSPGGPPTGSVIGNALDRGVGVTKYGDHFAHLCGMEVVLADGTVIQTGVARSDGKNGASHMYKWGVGPFVEGLFSQSNFGVVTKAGIWLMRKPEDYALFSLNIKNDAALAHCMNTVRDLMLDGVIPETGRFSNDVAILTLLTQAVNEGVAPKVAMTREELVALKEKYSVPGWTGSFGIYGYTPMVKSAVKIAKDKLKSSESCLRINCFSKKRAKRICSLIESTQNIKSQLVLKLVDRLIRKLLGSSLALVKLFPGLVDLHEGKPVETVVRRGYFRYQKKRPEKDIHVGRDDIGIMWSVPVLPFNGEEVVAFSKECELLFDQFNFDFYMTTMIFNARSVCPLMVILFDRLDKEECDRAVALYDAILDLSHKMGYQHFRAGINGWQKLYQSCSELKALNQKIKSALDPEGILAPGRYGID